MNIFKKTLIILTCALLVLIPALAFAQSPNVIDFDRTGSITVTLRDETAEHNVLTGYSLRLYYVAQAGEEHSQLVFNYTDAFAGCDFPLSDLSASGLTAALAAYAEETSIPYVIGTADEDGVVTFENLELGLYLIEQEDSAEGYYPIAPFIAAIPMTDPEGTAWVYDIDASPKAETKPEEPVLVEVTVEKVWQDEESEDRPASVTVNLLSDGEVIDSVVLSAENNWQHTFTELPDGHSYTVEEAAVPEGYVVSSEYGEFGIVITNTAKIPQTGLKTTALIVAAAVGAALVLGGIVFVAVSKKQREHA